ncbi:MAG: hypothetical protein H6812_08455 [Phycisphaeraceae bacterium]|nr:hypothetical protein [Phycisphaerales bacterium]MCB9843275.1 hypothetical protein [Phycisphaeraceae bacterium]
MPTTNRTRCVCVLAMWMMLFGAAGAVRGDVESMVGAVPGDALAYWVMDPGAFRREGAGVKKSSADRTLLLATLRAAVASGIAGSKSQAQWVEGLLAAAMVGEVPHTLAVLEFRAHRDDGAEKSEIDALQIVLVLHTNGRHDEYLRTMRAILIDAAKAKGLPDDAAGTQRRLDLPGGRNGVAYRAKAWPAWREVSWCSEGDRFVIALGAGALDRWFASDAPEPPIGSRRGLRGATRPKAALGTVEAFLDLDGLRERFPEGFDEGRVERMVAALDLQDASALLVRASLVEAPAGPALLAIDWITEVEGEPDVLAVTESAWPAGMDGRTFPVSGATYVAIARAEWRAIYDRAIRIHSATLKQRAAEKFNEKHEAWLSAHGDELWALTNGLGEWLVLTDVPEPVLPVPGLGSVFVAARDGVGAESLDARLSALLGSMKGVVRTEDGLWSLKVDDAGVVRIPAWAFLDGERGAMLAGGWGPPVVAHAREAMKEKESE